MEFSPRAAELTTLLESRMTNFYMNFQVDEIGRVVSVGDGIARVYGLNEIQAGEMVEFASGVKGIALNLENENVGIVVFGSDTAIKEGDLVKRTRAEDISESSSSKKKQLLTSRDEGSDQSEQTVRKRLRRGSMRPKGGPLLHV